MDEAQKLENYKRFATVATRDLLLTKERAKPFIAMIEKAKSQAEVSRVMTKVRHAI